VRKRSKWWMARAVVLRSRRRNMWRSRGKAMSMMAPFYGSRIIGGLMLDLYILYVG
jgi:hypothetical protein